MNDLDTASNSCGESCSHFTRAMPYGSFMLRLSSVALAIPVYWVPLLSVSVPEKCTRLRSPTSVFFQSNKSCALFSATSFAGLKYAPISLTFLIVSAASPKWYSATCSLYFASARFHGPRSSNDVAPAATGVHEGTKPRPPAKKIAVASNTAKATQVKSQYLRCSRGAQ